jgi:preprotein translocase subunit SecG
MKLVLGIVVILMSIALTVLVLMQSGKGKELGSAITGSSNSYLGNSKVSDKDKLLFKITAVLAVVFVLCVLVLYVVA